MAYCNTDFANVIDLKKNKSIDNKKFSPSSDKGYHSFNFKFSPDEKFLACYGGGIFRQIWSFEDNQLLDIDPKNLFDLMSGDFIFDFSSQLIGIVNNYNIEVYDIKYKKKLLDLGGYGEIKTADFINDGKSIISCHNNKIVLWKFDDDFKPIDF